MSERMGEALGEIRDIAYRLHMSALMLETFFRKYPEYKDVIYNPQWGIAEYAGMVDKGVAKLAEIHAANEEREAGGDE